MAADAARRRAVGGIRSQSRPRCRAALHNGEHWRFFSFRSRCLQFHEFVFSQHARRLSRLAAHFLLEYDKVYRRTL